MSETGKTPQGSSPLAKLSNWNVGAYALGDVANNLSFQMTSMFLMIYMTDIVGIQAAMAGTIYGITKIWAGFADLIAGNTVDRINTKWGHLRPWLLFGSLPLAFVLVMLFSTPAGLTASQSIAWVFLFDALFQLCYSFVNIPYGSLSAAITQDSVDRSRLSGARSIASAVTGVVLSAVLSPQFQNTAAEGVRQKFTITTIILACLALTLYIVTFLNTRERVQRKPGARFSMGATLKMLGKNKPLLILCAAAVFMLGGMFTMNANAMYYTRDVVGGAKMFTFLMLAQTIGTILSASFVPTITTKMGKRNGFIMFIGVFIIAYLTIFFAPAGELAMPLVGWFLVGLANGGANSLMFSMQADTVDYGEWQSGTRAEGSAYSILSFVRKLGQGLGGWGAGLVIQAFGYVKGAHQTPEAIKGIRLTVGVIPAIACAIAGLIILAYPLTVKRHREIVGELQQRRIAEAASEVGIELNDDSDRK